MSHLSEQQRNALRDQLLKEKNDLERRLAENDAFGENDALGSTTGELSAYDNHPADLGTEMYERGKDIALNESAEHQLEDIERALERMERGTYGQCAVCGKPIPFERLRAVPTTAYCYDHSPDKETSERRPAEERLLEPPFGRTSLDERSDQNQFDGEDAWQIVERWGTSDTPAMAEDRDVSDYDHMYAEADEEEGYVETIENFLATDLYGRNISVVRGPQYKEYMDKGEGERLLEPDPYVEPDNLPT